MRAGWFTAVVVSTVLVAGTMAEGTMPASARDRTDAATGWSRPVPLWKPPTAEADTRDLTLVTDSAGVVTACWLVVSGSSSRVLASRSSPKGWSPARVIATAPAGTEFAAFSATAGPSNEVVVALAAGRTDGATISATRFAGGVWSTQANLAEILGGGTYDPDSLAAVSTVSDGSGVWAVWQARPASAATAPVLARRLPSASDAWSEPSQLDAAATTSFVAVKDGPSTVRAVWQRGAEVVSAQASYAGWGAPEAIGPSGAPAEPFITVGPVRWRRTAVSATLDGTVVAAWTPQRTMAGCPTTLASVRTSAGWSPVQPVPMDISSTYCASEPQTLLGPGLAPTVISSHSERWVGALSSAAQWSGTSWVALPQVGGSIVAAGAQLVAVNVYHDYGASGPHPDIAWVTSSQQSGGAWSAPQRISDPGAGLVGDVASGAAPDGSLLVTYGKLPTWWSTGVWSVTYSAGTWSKARRVGPVQRTKKRAKQVDLSTPIVDGNGRWTAAWVLADAVLVSRS